MVKKEKIEEKVMWSNCFEKKIQEQRCFLINQCKFAKLLKMHINYRFSC